MLVEAIIPLRVKMSGQWLLLEPGKPVEFADDQAAKLLSRVPDKVRQVSPLPHSAGPLIPGMTIMWFSPLFGELNGELLAVHEDDHISVFHPLKEGVARIPVAWVRQKG